LVTKNLIHMNMNYGGPKSEWMNKILWVPCLHRCMCMIFKALTSDPGFVGQLVLWPIAVTVVCFGLFSEQFKHDLFI